VGESLARALLLLVMCILCGSVFLAPLYFSLRRRHLHAVDSPERSAPDAIVVINAVIGVYVIWCLCWVFLEP
jgi:hypothetical protein